MNNHHQKPVFSIIIPVLNEQANLPNLLKDISCQTFTNFEIIIVDGMSEDRTVANAERFRKTFPLFKIETSDKRNVCYQRNLGASKANAEWLVFMDADNRIPIYFLQGIKFQSEMLNADIISTWIKPDTNSVNDKSIALLVNMFMDANQHTPQSICS